MSSSRLTRSTIAAAGGALLLGALAPWAPAQAEPAPAVLACDVPDFNSTMDYPTTADVTAGITTGGVRITLSLGDMPGIVPLPLPATPVSGTATATVNGKPLTLTGTHTTPALDARAPIPTPVMSGTVAVPNTGQAVVKITQVNFVASAMGMDVAVNCTATSGLERTHPLPIPAPAPKPSATTSKATVKVSKKKVATVKVSVTAKKVKATGKVSVTVLKGKKKVVSKSLTLRKGSASLKTKKLTKGKYTVKVTYKATKTFKASKKTVTFRVK